MKYKNISALVIVVICATYGGFFLGSTYNGKSIVQGEDTDKYMTTKIAIVNQDEGIDSNGTNKNYATDLLNASEEEYVLTSKAAAQKGLDDGNYGAYIILPRGFSKNISSINDVTPVKAEMYYQVNDKLSSDKKIVVNESINSILSKFKSNTSYMYIASILREFHDGQAAINKVLENNANEEKNINSISDSEILANLKLNELKKVELNLEKLDMTEIYSDNVQQITNIENKYNESVTASSDSIDNIKTKAVNSNDTLIKFNLAFGALNINPTDKDSVLNNGANVIGDTAAKRLDDQIIAIQKNVNDLSAIYLNLNTQNTEITNVTNKINSDIGTYENSQAQTPVITSEQIKNNANNQDIIKNEKIGSLNEEYKIYNKLLSYLKNNNPSVLENFSQSVQNDQTIDYKKIVPYETTESFNEYINLGRNDYESLKVDSYSAVETDVTKLYSKIQTDNNLVNDIKISVSGLSTPIAGLNQVYNDAAANKVNLVNNANGMSALVQGNNSEIANKVSLNTENHWKDYISNKQTGINDLKNEFTIPYVNSLGLFSDIASFNSLDLLDKNKVTIDEYITKLYKNNKDIENKVSDKENKDDEAVKAIYDTCDLNIMTMNKDLSEGFKNSQEKLSAGLKTLKENRGITSSNTVANLTNLANKLPNTRIGTVENTNIYNFIADPITSINTQIALGSKIKQ
jgi:YhgE/Pip-like protein